jgi:hypothetical protein
MGIGDSFPGGKAAGSWSWPLSSIKYRNQEWWSCTVTVPCMYIAWCLVS